MGLDGGRDGWVGGVRVGAAERADSTARDGADMQVNLLLGWVRRREGETR